MKLTADDLKKCLNECISEIVFHHNEFSLVPKAFSRTRKWPLDKLIHFILSFGSQSLGTEILEYFQFQDGFPSVSSFVQQRKKLSFQAMEGRKLLFTTQTCPNCVIAKRALEEAQIEYEVIDAQENKEMVKKYGVMQAPTMVIVGGDSVEKYVNASNITKYAQKQMPVK